MNRMRIRTTLGLLAIAALLIITPANAVWNDSRLSGSGPMCGALVAPNDGMLATMPAPAPPQGDTQGCCVLKSGAQNEWRYINTTSQNCTQLARNANISYSFYPNTDCGKVKPN